MSGTNGYTDCGLGAGARGSGVEAPTLPVAWVWVLGVR